MVITERQERLMPEKKPVSVEKKDRIDDALEDVARHTPARGYRLCGLDDFPVPPELFDISWHATRAEAERAQAEWSRENPDEKSFIYGRDEETSS
jgi:hypothetical protein